MGDALSIFHPLIQRWFAERVGTPTRVQAEAWPVIARGEHALITAPTGSGKTLTAFLWALNQLITGAWGGGKLRVLYVSPLKALNNDIQRNLLSPLAELQAVFHEAGEPSPDIRVLTRSGDTEQTERRRMLRQPPEILITTPESLNLLLSTRSAQPVLKDLATVILDEIHYVAGTKRGTHLITAVDRLVRLSGEFQRIAISATVRPLELIADFVGGFKMPAQDVYEKRPVTIVAPSEKRRYDITVHFLSDPDFAEPGTWGAPPFMERLAKELKKTIAGNRSTLLFTNNRALCERVAMYINEDEPEVIAYPHHGSLSREVRAVVEQRLKRGQLKAIVATSSLELGIDIGALNEVLLVQTPMSISSAIQRIGRAGHQVGAVSRGSIHPTHGRDIVDAAAIAGSIKDQDIEPLQPISNPLDILAQIIVSMVGVEMWHIEALYAFLRTSWPYHDLSRTQFDLVLDMLAGRYKETRLRSLQSLVSIDKLDQTVQASQSSLRRVYGSGGTIPDRGYFTLRRAGSNAKIGELDEEFVWERSLGDVFNLSLQSWKIISITHNDVIVEPARHAAAAVPFWKAEELDRPFYFSDHIAAFLEWAERTLDLPGFEEKLIERYNLDTSAAGALITFLKRQRAVTRAPLPHRKHILVEHYVEHEATDECTRVIIHTLWGGRVNRPFAIALAQAWEDKYGQRLQLFANNDCVVLIIPGVAEKTDVFSLLRSDTIDTLIRRKLEQTGFFGARFRENAARALLLPRQSFARRMPLWFSRLRSKKLLESILKFEDFPILIETWRTCLCDEFDLSELKKLLDDVYDGIISVTEITTDIASPFANSILWRATNTFMYADDTPEGGASQLHPDLLKEAVFSSELRPAISAAVARTFEQKVQRTYPGYAPRTANELLDWVKERILISQPEWLALTSAIQMEADEPIDELLRPLARKLVLVTIRDGVLSFVAAVESVPRLRLTLELPKDASIVSIVDGEPLKAPVARIHPEEDAFPDFLAEWLRFYGPVSKPAILRSLPVDAVRLEDALDALLEARTVIVDHLVEGAREVQVCDSENLEILLRLNRAAARPAFTALPAERLPLFLAHYQGLTRRTQDVQRPIEGLFGYPMSAELLETEILPARLQAYAAAALDGVMAETDLIWTGCGVGKILLCLPHYRDLFCRDAPGAPDPHQVFLDPRARYAFSALLEQSGVPPAELTQRLWQWVWHGFITNDTFAALRKGIETDFKAVEASFRAHVSRRAHFGAWKSARTYPGNWYMLPPCEAFSDALDEEELNKERVRVLLDRYGILFRELLAHELPALRWGALFRTLRLMELSGEIVAGLFFDGIPGLQFASQKSLAALRQPLDDDAIFWLNAADPASLCGIDLESFKGALPKRVPGTHLVYRGHNVVITSKRHGKELEIHADPEDEHLPKMFGFLKHLVERSVRPLPSITIEHINNERPNKSPYLKTLRQLFDVTLGPKGASLWRAQSGIH